MPVGPATIPVTRSVYQSYAVVSATPADVRGYVFWTISGPKGTGQLTLTLLFKQTNKPTEKNWWVVTILLKNFERILGPKCRVLYTASRLIFKSTNTSYAWHPHNRR